MGTAGAGQQTGATPLQGDAETRDPTGTQGTPDGNSRWQPHPHGRGCGPGVALLLGIRVTTAPGATGG